MPMEYTDFLTQLVFSLRILYHTFLYLQVEIDLSMATGKAREGPSVIEIL
jgi:hypothetical protein